MARRDAAEGPPCTSLPRSPSARLAWLSERCLGLSAARSLPSWRARNFFNTTHAGATRDQLLAAAATMRAAQTVLYEAKQKLGIWPGAKIDPNHTGMVGQEYTAMTTTAGTLSNKRTATQPDFAAALAKRMAALGLAA